MKMQPMSQPMCATIRDTDSASPRQLDLLQRAVNWWRRTLCLGFRAPRRLHLCENLPLGDRRFVALVECEGSRFLLGGTPTSLVLLARLENQSQPARAASSQLVRSTEEAH